MNRQFLVNNLFIIAMLAFFLPGTGCRINKIHCGAFNYFVSAKDSDDSRNYIVQNDGTKIYGDKISYKSGLLVKNMITIDGQSFRID